MACIPYNKGKIMQKMEQQSNPGSVGICPKSNADMTAVCGYGWMAAKAVQFFNNIFGQSSFPPNGGPILPQIRGLKEPEMQNLILSGVSRDSTELSSDQVFA